MNRKLLMSHGVKKPMQELIGKNLVEKFTTSLEDVIHNPELGQNLWEMNLLLLTLNLLMNKVQNTSLGKLFPSMLKTFVLPSKVVSLKFRDLNQTKENFLSKT